AHNFRTSITVGARVVQNSMGLTGAGVGIAVLDSGITAWHDDLTNKTAKLFPYGNQRVAKFVDFVNGRTMPYDDNGHGSHAAGILGKNAAGGLQYGGITAPGNAPWVLTVGASSTMGTFTRNDDQMAPFSSAGPSYIDFEAKPDLVAPGVGTVSLAVPGSSFYSSKAQYLLGGTRPLGSMPYLTLSGTSMAAPVVTGSVALMLQANPKLTPNLVKAILQYTAQEYPGYTSMRQGAGFLNTLGAVRLAQYYVAPKAGDRVPVQKVWSQQILW